MNLPRYLKIKINKMAHNAGLIHAEQTKTRLMAEIEQRITNGATFEELKAHLDSLQAEGRA